MLKAVLIMLASLGIIDGDTEGKKELTQEEQAKVEASSVDYEATVSSDQDNDSKHSTKEGL